VSDRPDIRFFRDSVEGRKGEILDAAVSVFALEGYANGSMRRIAEEVGLTEPALYRHFAGKEDLFVTIIEHTGERIRSEVSPILQSATPDRLHEAAQALLSNRRGAAPAYVAVIQTILLGSAHNPAFLGAYRSAIVDPVVERLSATVPAFDAHFGTESDPGELPGRVRLLISLIAGYFVMSYVFDAEELPIGDAIMRLMGWSES